MPRWKTTSDRKFVVPRAFEKVKMHNFSKESINSWLPSRKDIRRIVSSVRHMHKVMGFEGKPTVLEIGGGNGFFARLLAEEGIQVVVLDPNVHKDHFCGHPNITELRTWLGTVADARRQLSRAKPEDRKHAQKKLELFEKLIRQRIPNVSELKGTGLIPKNISAVINMWPSEGIGLDPELRALKAPLIITGLEKGDATGIDNQFHPGRNYKKVAEWSGITHYDTYRISEGRHYENLPGLTTETHVRRDLVHHRSSLIERMRRSDRRPGRYHWEKDFEDEFDSANQLAAKLDDPKKAGTLEVIRNTPELAFLENGWRQRKNGAVEVLAFSERSSLYPELLKLKKGEVFIHNHPPNEKSAHPAFPSEGDLLHWVKERTEQGSKHERQQIVCIGRKGEIIGVTTLDLLPESSFRRKGELNMAIPILKTTARSYLRISNEKKPKALRDLFGIAISFKPMKGYYLDKKTGRYEKRVKK
ncbi:MAG: hypothetical protein ABIA76_04345 [Candidatus Diapherotrites archaeon]